MVSTRINLEERKTEQGKGQGARVEEYIDMIEPEVASMMMMRRE